jgi:hypothetical protein
MWLLGAEPGDGLARCDSFAFNSDVALEYTSKRRAHFVLSYIAQYVSDRNEISVGQLAYWRKHSGSRTDNKTLNCKEMFSFVLCCANGCSGGEPFDEFV